MQERSRRGPTPMDVGAIGKGKDGKGKSKFDSDGTGQIMDISTKFQGEQPPWTVRPK